jgi:protein-disulfide isomerase
LKKSYLLITALVLAVLAFWGASSYYSQAEASRLSQLASGDNNVFRRPHAPVKGPASAKVVIVEFLDPACEACRAFYPLVEDLVRRSEGKVKLVLRYAPFHKGSDEAIAILEAARAQGLYWSALEATLKQQPVWAAHHNPQPQLIWNALSGIGLDIDKAKEEAKSPRITAIIEQDLLDGKELRVEKTPSFFVNGKPLSSFGYEQLQDLVNAEVAAAYKN